HDLQEGLSWSQTAADLCAEGAQLHAIDEVTHHWQRNVGFKQRATDITQAVLNVVFGQLRLAAERAQSLAKIFCKFFEHDSVPVGSRRGPGSAHVVKRGGFQRRGGRFYPRARTNTATLVSCRIKPYSTC